MRAFRNVCSGILAAFGVTTIISGILTLVVYNDLYHAIMKSQMKVTYGTYSFDMWRETPIPMYMSVYYFNCTNAEEIMDDSYNIVNQTHSPRPKPLLKQVGPYVWKEYHEKTNITYSEDGDDWRINYYQKKYWIYDEEKSNGTLDDWIWTLNMIAVQAAEATRWPGAWAEGDYPFMQNMLGASIKLNNETLFMKAVIRNLTFDGIDSPLLHMGDDAGGMLGDMLDNQIPFDRFGWFYDRNNSETYDGVYQMFSGLDDIYKVGQISEWQGKSNLSDFYPEGCHDLVGSAGEFFPQDRDKTSLSYFTPDLCRPIYFNFKEETTVEGIHGYKYALDEGFWGNSSTNSSNWCYNPEPDMKPDYFDDFYTDEHTPPNTPNLHLPNGLLNVSSCKFDSAAYVSLPHFHLADPALLDQFHPDSELAPTEEEHSSYLSILPKQGIPLEVAIRMQINTLYRPITKWIDFLEGLEPTYYPAVWFEVKSELPDDMRSQLKMLEWVPDLGHIFGGIFLGLGIIFIVGGVILNRWSSIGDVLPRKKSPKYLESLK